MIDARISCARAHVADSTAVVRLLDEVPEAEDIHAEIARPYFARRWQQSTERSFWISSDGTTVTCLTLTGLDIDAMVALWVTFDGYHRRPGFTLSAVSLQEIVEAELGVTVELES